MRAGLLCNTILAAFVGLLLDTSAAEGIPAFARKYRASCSLCHDPVPRLNAFGEQFAANGFEFVVNEPPRDTLQTGDNLLRLLSRIELALRLDAYATASTPIRSDRTSVDLQTPYNIKPLSGGPIAEKISYYMYFFLSERGEVAGLEDAYLQFTDIGGTGVSVVAGQFQVSDPMFKRELRLEYEDYQAYRIRVGDVRADLTYDRGFMILNSPWAGADAALFLVNGQGLNAAAENRLYDRDNLKNIAIHYSQRLGNHLRVGGLAYWGRERADGETDRIVMWGPDATLSMQGGVEVNAQFIRREDTNPVMVPGGESSTVNSAFADLVWGPVGQQRRWYLAGLYNWVDADRPLVSLRVGEGDTEAGFLGRYHTARCLSALPAPAQHSCARRAGLGHRGGTDAADDGNDPGLVKWGSTSRAPGPVRATIASRFLSNLKPARGAMLASCKMPHSRMRRSPREGRGA